MKVQLTLPAYIVDVMDVFRLAGFSIFVVGGPVRDLLMGRPIDNWDLTTNASPEAILKLFPSAKSTNDFGTIIVPLANGNSDDNAETPHIIAEITPFRKEGDYSDGRHPDTIEWAKTLEEDLIRRDFTINAIAYDGEALTDTTGGLKDIDAQIVRAVGDPAARFQEDGLRLMRAIRFAVQLGFTIEPETYSAISTCAAMLQKISWERIRDELLKILASAQPAEGIMLLKETGLLAHILPEVDANFGVTQKSPNRHHIYDVGTHLVEALRHCDSPDPIIRLAALLHDIGKAQTHAIEEATGTITFYNHEIVGADMVSDIADRLRLSKKQKKLLVTLVRHHMFSVNELQTDKAVRRFIRNVGKENIDAMLAVRHGDRVGSGAKPTSWRTELFKKRIVEVQQRPFDITDLKINGHDVMTELQVKPGPIIGELLQKLFEEVAAETLVNEKAPLMAKLHELASQ